MWIELVGHTTYILLALSYVVRDMVWLRAITIPASICSIVFNYVAPTEPLWLIINWNLVFLVLNVGQLGISYSDFRQYRDSSDVREFVSCLNVALNPHHAVGLFRLAESLTIGENETLLAEGQDPHKLYLLLSGEVEIARKNNYLARCGSGCFLGEISYLHRSKCSANVVTKSECRLLVWPADKLRSVMRKKPHLNIVLQSALAANLSATLQQRETTETERDLVEV